MQAAIRSHASMITATCLLLGFAALSIPEGATMTASAHCIEQSSTGETTVYYGHCLLHGWQEVCYYSGGDPGNQIPECNWVSCLPDPPEQLCL